MTGLKDAALLRGVGLSKAVRGRRILADVTVEVERGETVGLLGPNGAGKSTCFYILAGLRDPSAGKVIFEGEDITSLPVDRRAVLGIGFLPQERSLFSALSVLDNIRAVLEIRGGARPAEIIDRSLALLHEMGVEHLAEQSAASLSGGEMRRVEIARALALRPRILLMDEPFAAIDPLTVSDLRDVLARLRDTGISLLISDHNVRETLATCDRGYILHEGSVLCHGTPEELADNEQVRTHYLGQEFRM